MHPLHAARPLGSKPESVVCRRAASISKRTSCGCTLKDILVELGVTGVLRDDTEDIKESLEQCLVVG